MKREREAADVGGLRKKRDALAQALAATPDWVLGSLVETVQKRNGKKVPFRYLSRSVEGKNRILYVSAAQVAAFSAAGESAREACRLLEEISELNAAIIKAGGRP